MNKDEIYNIGVAKSNKYHRFTTLRKSYGEKGPLGGGQSKLDDAMIQLVFLWQVSESESEGIKQPFFLRTLHDTHSPTSHLGNDQIAHTLHARLAKWLKTKS